MKLEKFFVDYDRSITVVPKSTTRKIRLTSVVNADNNFTLWTMEPEEFKERFVN